MDTNHAGRMDLLAAWQRGAGTVNVLSGIPAQARALYVSVQGRGEGRVDFEMAGTRWGFSFRQRFSLGVGQVVAVNADGLRGVTLDAIASSVVAGEAGQVVASWSPNPRDSADVSTAWWIDQYAAEVHLVPNGARRLVLYTGATDLEWILYDGTGTERALAVSATVGAVEEVLGTHFRPGASFYGAFEIQL